jgi:virginiamycin A acetyltransferase
VFFKPHDWKQLKRCYKPNHEHRDSKGVIFKIYLRKALKLLAQGFSLVLAFPFAALAGFGRISSTFRAFAQFLSLAPGIPGDYLRVSFYALTLDKCSINSRVSFGTFFAQRSVTVGEGVYIGPYCVIGTCQIGERTQIASQVQVLSGRHQHARGVGGHIMGSNEADFSSVAIGADCWIGASAIIMADIGSGTTIGAGSVVTRVVPSNVVAVGNPARVLDRSVK